VTPARRQVLRAIGRALAQRRAGGALDLPGRALEEIVTAFLGRACAGSEGARACWVDLAAIAIGKLDQLDGLTDLASETVARAARELGPNARDQAPPQLDGAAAPRHLPVHRPPPHDYIGMTAPRDD
jgi:hypothetical protein